MALRVEVRQDVMAFTRRAAIHPGNDGGQRLVLFIQQQGVAAGRGHAERADAAVWRHVACTVAQHRDQVLEMLFGIQFLIAGSGAVVA